MDLIFDTRSPVTLATCEKCFSFNYVQCRLKNTAFLNVFNSHYFLFGIVAKLWLILTDFKHFFNMIISNVYSETIP